MLLTIIFTLASIAATAVTYILCSCLSPWWILLLIPAYYLAAAILYIIWLFTAVLLTDGTDPSPA